MTPYLVLLALALEADAAMALPRQQPVPAPSPSLSPTLPKVIKVPPGSLSSSSGGAAVPSQQQTPSVAEVESPSIMDAKAPKLPPDEGKVPPPPQETPGKDPKPTVVEGGGNVVSVSTAAPTFVLNDDEAANEADETPMEPSTESVVSMMPTFLPTEYASGLISESPFLSKSLPTYFPTMSTEEELPIPFPTMIPTRDVGLSSDGQVSPMDTQTDSGNNNHPNGTHSSIYLSDAVTQSTLVPEEINSSGINDNTAPQPLSSDTILQYGLISVSLGFILSSVAMLGVMRRRVTAQKRSEELPSTLANGSVL